MATSGPPFSSHYLNAMNLESKNKCTVLGGTWIIRVIEKFFTANEFVHESTRKLPLPQTLIQSTNKHDGNLCCLSGLRRSCVALTKWCNVFRVWGSVLVYFYSLSVPARIFRLDWNSYTQIQYLIFVWGITFGVTFRCIGMISMTNKSISYEC